MRFVGLDVEGKLGYLREKLLLAGHTAANSLDQADLLLIDCDWEYAPQRRSLIAAAVDAGARVALYPHGAFTTFVYDGLTTPDSHVDVRLEHGVASLDLAALLELDLRQRACGWLYSPTAPFAPVEKPRKVLFAGLHPNMEALVNGTNGHDPAPALNSRVYRDLLRLGYEVTVSAVGPLWRNGVWPHPRARIFGNPQMLFHPSYKMILDADVVIAAGTMAATAVACGKPTIMLGQGNYADYVGGRYVEPDHVDLYDAQLRYPLDVEAGDLDDLIARACQGDEGAAEWRARFVGDDGTARAIEILEHLTNDLKRDVAVEGVRAAASFRL